MPAFVVQQHAATTLHFDLRLEVGGVLRSWAVPKGPSRDPRQRRLAIEVEDHPLAWGRFEGRVPIGRGRGAVIVWDRGTYENVTERDGVGVPMDEALANGHAVFALHGEKMVGAWSLRRIEDGPKPQWLLVKKRDETAADGDDLVAAEPRSVVSGRTIEEL